MSAATPIDDAGNSDRYSRQARFAPLGKDGQSRLGRSKALICGCGALGSAVAESLVRAGVGTVAIVDRDFVELSNLHRQSLFDEQDAAEQLPKAIAAARRLRCINSQVRVEATVADLTAANLPSLAAGVDVVVDGLDNFETRYLINDYCVQQRIPWVFGGCVGAEGQTLAILPEETACLACLLPEPPPRELQPTCESAGVVGPIVSLIAAFEAVEALKILSGNREAVHRRMTIVDLWQNQLRTIALERNAPSNGCRTCGERDFPWLDGRRGSAVTVLCGRNSVQIAAQGPAPDLGQLAEKLRSAGNVFQNAFLVRLDVPPHAITVFGDGRAIVSGTSDVSVARALATRFLGG